MKPLIVANWKCNPASLAEAKQLFDSVGEEVKNIKGAKAVICPPFVYLSVLRPSEVISIGGQDCFWEQKGAFTGEISPLMLKDLGCEYVILGHSERRRNLNETDEMVQKKLKAALAAGLKPVLCVGSKSMEKEKEFSEMEIQATTALDGVEKESIGTMVFTYEPVWAISTSLGGRIASPKEAKEGSQLIRKILSKLFGVDVAKAARVIYGGSVNSSNAPGFVKEGEMDGVLVGAASLDVEEFIGMVRNVAKIGKSC